MSRRVDPQWCPVCFHKLDATTFVHRNGEPLPPVEPTPKPDDYTVCIDCASVLQFGKDLKLREIKLIDVDIAQRMKVAQVQTAIRTMGRPGPLNVWKM